MLRKLKEADMAEITITVNIGAGCGIRAAREAFDRAYLADLVARTGSVERAAEVAGQRPDYVKRRLRRLGVRITHRLEVHP